MGGFEGKPRGSQAFGVLYSRDTLLLVLDCDTMMEYYHLLSVGLSSWGFSQLVVAREPNLLRRKLRSHQESFIGFPFLEGTMGTLFGVGFKKGHLFGGILTLA